MVDANICNRDLYCIQSFRDVRDPFIPADCRETLSYRFVASCRRDFDGMRNAIHIADRDAA